MCRVQLLMFDCNNSCVVCGCFSSCVYVKLEMRCSVCVCVCVILCGWVCASVCVNVSIWFHILTQLNTSTCKVTTNMT